MKYLIAAVSLSLSSCCAFGEGIERMPVTDALELTDQEIAYAKSIAELDGPVPMLYGGRPVEAGELLPNVNVGFCSVTIVGPETVVSAGHCHNTGSKASFVFAGTKYSATCTRHPQYNNGTLLNDFALCKFSPRGDFPKYGNLGVYPVAPGDVIVMNGYGKGSTNGRLHVGKMPIARVQGQEIFTEGGVVIGSGDSGSAAYLDMPNLKDGPFKIVSINSRAGGRLSILNMTGDSRAQAFFKDWAAKNSAEVCGINKDCLGEDVIIPPPPPLPPEIPSHCAEEKKMFDLQVSKLAFFESMLKKCK